jgi:uncharacterized protein HemY
VVELLLTSLLLLVVGVVVGQTPEVKAAEVLADIENFLLRLWMLVRPTQ